MFIYTISSHNKEIYVGQTKNTQHRWYCHRMSALNENSPKSNQSLYTWMRKVGVDNLMFSIECECDDSISRDVERNTVKKYEQLGYKLYNRQLTRGYGFSYARFEHRDEVYDMIVNQNISDDEVANHFGISKSLIGKIMSERGVHRNKLYKFHKEIQQKIISGVPLRQLAREYNVCKSAIGNINNGTAYFDESLDYPLNKNVRDENLRKSWFKSKV